MSQPAYTTTAKSLHWLIACLLFGLLALGFYMQSLPFSPRKLQLMSWHKWAGVTVFLLVWLRLGWRITHPAPALPAHMNAFERLAAHGGHALLYVLMLAIPLSGWLMSSAKGFQTVWFGVLPLPDLVARDRATGDLLAQVHVALNWMLIAMIVLHVLAALKHHFIDRDGLLERILFRFTPEK